MCGKQKTLDSYDERSGTECPNADAAALSMHLTQSEEKVIYHDLIESVLDDENIEIALGRVVGNKGAPGIDGMSVFELQGWLHDNIDSLKQSIREGSYIPTPVRRKEIPKPNGGVRNLGIPTVRDRLVQQMVAQVLEPIYEPTFSDHSFGFRPGRSAQDAVLLARNYYEEGFTVMVDLDLEKFFDNLNQDYLMNLLRERIKDQVLITLVKRFLRAGVALPNGLIEATPKGSPQGGPLSPLLSNIYLDRFDRLLESRGLRFCRYADDCAIFVRSQRAGERVRDSCTRYLEGTLRLKVNREKTKVGSPADLQFLGFNIVPSRDGTAMMVPSPEKVARFRRTVRRITKRNRGVSPKTVISELNTYVRGWFGYYGLTDDQWLIVRLDKWVRRRVRQFILKKWKRFQTIVGNLRGLCPRKVKAMFEDQRRADAWLHGCRHAASAKGWWDMSRRPTVQQAMNNQWLRDQGMYFMLDDWENVRERCFNRRVPNGMHGGVRGRLAD